MSFLYRNPWCCGTGFGTPGAFGAAAPAPGMGSRAAPYTKTQDVDSQQSAGGQKQTVFFNSISAMPAYVSKSVEELRHEDYAVRSPRRHQRSRLCCRAAPCVHQPAGVGAPASAICKVQQCSCIDSSAVKRVSHRLQSPLYTRPDVICFSHSGDQHLSAGVVADTVEGRGTGQHEGIHLPTGGPQL